MTQSAAKEAGTRAVEKELPLKDLKGPGKSGYYYSATDREVEPDGYKYLTQGGVGFGELAVSFTILANKQPQEVAAKGLEIVRTMRRSGTKGAS